MDEDNCEMDEDGHKYYEMRKIGAQYCKTGEMLEDSRVKTQKQWETVLNELEIGQKWGKLATNS